MTRKIGPMLPGVVHVPYPDLYRRYAGETEHDVAIRYFNAFKAPFESFLPADETACVLVEPIQGDGGIVKAPEEICNWFINSVMIMAFYLLLTRLTKGLAERAKCGEFNNIKILNRT